MSGRWHPRDSRHGGPGIEVGMIVALDYQAWRVTYVELEDPDTVQVRAVKADGSDPREGVMTAPVRHYWDVLPEHYSVCVHCGDVQPCREQEAERISGLEVKRAERFEFAGFCPACLEPVTARQQSVTFEENTAVPLGPARHVPPATSLPDPSNRVRPPVGEADQPAAETRNEPRL
jgi:hypothetical protein